MRRSFPPVLALTVAMLVGGVARAQITLVPGPPQLVARAPEFIAAADFNGDGFDDAAVINPGSDKVTVLFGSADGSFSSLIDLAVGRRLENIAAADLNSDNKADIAVATNFQRLVYRIPGNGDGTFRKPVGFEVGATARDVAVANFDGRQGLDLVTVGESIDLATVLVNAGGNQGFNPGGDFPVGNRPKRVVTADLNSDGKDDIIALNTGTAGADDISVLLNTGSGTQCCSFGFPINFVVGVNAVDVAVGDFNNDGVPDVLVLNSGNVSTANSLTVSVLLNRTKIVGGVPVGIGQFDVETPVLLSCPSSVGGIPITCRPQTIAAADFDIDGFVDFVVSFETLAQSGATLTPGLLSAYAGRGNGSFDFATQVSVGLRPRGIVSGDFTGDGVPDLAVAEFGSRSVRIVASVPPPPIVIGECNIDRQCESRFCVDDQCCSTRACPSGFFCNIPGSEGHCHQPLPNGAMCEFNQQCQSEFCVDGFCCGSRQCQDGQFCNTGSCKPPTENGTPCNDAKECAFGACTHETCCELPRCPANEFCNIPGHKGICTAPSPDGSPCTAGEQCLSTFCVDTVCCGSDTCQAGESCNLPGTEGICRPIPTLTPTLTATPTATPTTTPTVTLTPTLTQTQTFTPTPQPNGAPCASGTQCLSGSCADATCCDLPAGTAQCPNPGDHCNISDSRGTCDPQKTTGQQCGADPDCATANCDGSTVPPKCGPTKTPTRTATITPTATRTATPTATPLGLGDGCVPGGSPCNSVLLLQCIDGLCCDAGGSTHCPTGQVCNDFGSEGHCTLPKPSDGQACDPNAVDPCQPGLVCNPDNLVCCESDNCAPGQRCDIFGFGGQCMDPLLADDECEKNTDCTSGLLCTLDQPPKRHCLPPGSPTPTFIPAHTPTPTTGIIVSASKGGGCSIGDGADAPGVWVFAGVPFALWLRRRSRLIRLQTRRQ